MCVFFFFNAFSFFRCFLASHCKNQVIVFFFSLKNHRTKLFLHSSAHSRWPHNLFLFFFQSNTKEGDAQKPANHVCKSSELLLSSSLLVSFGNVRTNVFFFFLCVSLLTTTAAKKKKKKTKKKNLSLSSLWRPSVFFFFYWLPISLFICYFSFL